MASLVTVLILWNSSTKANLRQAVWPHFNKDTDVWTWLGRTRRSCHVSSRLLTGHSGEPAWSPQQDGAARSALPKVWKELSKAQSHRMSPQREQIAFNEHLSASTKDLSQLVCVREDVAALCPPGHSRQTRKSWDRMTDVTQIASNRPLTLSSWLHTGKDTDSDLNMVKAHFCFDSSYWH